MSNPDFEQEGLLSEEKSENITEIPDHNYVLAATFVKNSLSGKYVPFDWNNPKCISRYVSYNSVFYEKLLKSCFVLNLLLIFCEYPAVPNLELPPMVCLGLELVTLAYFCFRLVQRFMFSEAKRIKTDYKYIMSWVVILITVLDIIVYLILRRNIDKVNFHFASFRYSRVLRPLFLINFPVGFGIGSTLNNVRLALPDISKVFFLLWTNVAIFALIANQLLFDDKLKMADGSAYFSNYGDSIWDLYVLLTTANYPDIMMPAYDQNKGYAFLFCIFIHLNLFIMCNLNLATIYTNYKDQLMHDVKVQVFRKRKLLIEAFNRLKTWDTTLNKYVVTPQSWNGMSRILNPQNSFSENSILFLIVGSGERYIDLKAFLTLGDLLLVSFDEEKKPEGFLGKCYNWKGIRSFKKVVTSIYFSWTIHILILANAICVGFVYNKLEIYFLAVFILELIVKMIAYGPRDFKSSVWNLFDSVIVVVALALIIYLKCFAEAESSKQKKLLDLVLVFRLLRIIRILQSIKSFKSILNTVVYILPTIVRYAAVALVLMYIYSFFGMLIYYGKINYYGYTNLTKSTEYCGNRFLKGSSFYGNRYCNLNFNDMGSGLMIMFVCLIVNNWQFIVEGFGLVSNKYFARGFFFTYNVIMVSVIFNIVTAFIIEIFDIENTIRSAKSFDTKLEEKLTKLGLLIEEHGLSGRKRKLTIPPMIKDQGIGFILSSNRTKPTAILLQQMFEAELDTLDDCENLDLDRFESLQEVSNRGRNIDIFR